MGVTVKKCHMIMLMPKNSRTSFFLRAASAGGQVCTIVDTSLLLEFRGARRIFPRVVLYPVLVVCVCSVQRGAESTLFPVDYPSRRVGISRCIPGQRRYAELRRPASLLCTFWFRDKPVVGGRPRHAAVRPGNRLHESTSCWCRWVTYLYILNAVRCP